MCPATGLVCEIHTFERAAFVIYDYIITLGQEIEMFWMRKFTGATALFLLNRYLVVLDYVFNIATIERTSSIVSLDFHLALFGLCHR